MRIVGYVRVSTDRQGASGLGLEAQVRAIRDYASAHRGEIVEIIEEVESGRKNDRPAFVRARALAKRIRARLVIAKLDRLSRSVSFIAALMDSGVEFAACDMPEANRLTLHVMAAFAEHEAHAISVRTKAALAAYKARGGTLGGYRGVSPDLAVCRAGQARSVVARLANTQDALDGIAPHLIALRDQGHSMNAIAKHLTKAGIATVSGRPTWQGVQVKAALARLG